MPEAPAEEKEVKEEEANPEESAPAAPESEKSQYPFFDPYDFKRDLFDPSLYAKPEPEE